jgi:hypothetical protein
MTDDQFNTLLSELRIIQTKIGFIESDIAEIRDEHLHYVLEGLKTVVASSLDKVQEQEAKSYKVERM